MEGLRERASRVTGDVVETGEMIAFKHTIFALPFAVISLITAASPGWPPAQTWLWVGLAMVSARTAAMAFNRLADHNIDSMNPRTAGRALPAGRLSRRFAWIVTAVSAALFIAAAANLNPLCLALAPPTLAVLLGYSYAKRMTAASHLWLGLAIGIAPIGAWIAVTARLAWPPVILASAVSLWVAGFDIIYSLQDESFDRAHSLHSLPAQLGGHRALLLAGGFHVLAFVGFLLFASAAGGGWIRYSAVIAAGVILAWQHRAVMADGLDAVGAAFFTANGTLAVCMSILFVIAKLTGS